MSGVPTPVLLAKVPLGIRFQEPVALLIYLAGFLAPWERSGAHATLWLALSTWAARSGLLAVANATTAVTVAALACLVLGTIVRVGGAVMRRRLHLGGWLIALGTSILMPPSGAVGFLLLFSLFSLFLAITEKRFLSASVAAVRAGDPPRWWKAVLAETYPIAFTACFALFAWRYNTTLVIRCLLICYGVSLMVRALSPP